MFQQIIIESYQNKSYGDKSIKYSARHFSSETVYCKHSYHPNRGKFPRKVHTMFRHSYWCKLVMAILFGLYQKKKSHALFVLKQAKKFESLKTLYYALIQPHLQYGILAWGNARSSALQKKTSYITESAIRTLNRAHYKSYWTTI